MDKHEAVRRLSKMQLSNSCVSLSHSESSEAQGVNRTTRAGIHRLCELIIENYIPV